MQVFNEDTKVISIDVIFISLLSTLNVLSQSIMCFYCQLWTCNSLGIVKAVHGFFFKVENRPVKIADGCQFCKPFTNFELE